MLGFNRPMPVPVTREGVEMIVRRQNSFQRVLSHTGKTIHDVINCPISRQTVLGYYKLSRFIDRQGEVSELEQQWNPLGRRY